MIRVLLLFKFLIEYIRLSQKDRLIQNFLSYEQYNQLYFLFP
jgi:hypothetical protein